MSARGSLGPRVKLRSVCSIVAGQSPSSSAYNGDGNGLPFYQGKKDFTDRYLAAPSVWTTETTKRALSGDIVMSVRAPVGPVNEVREEICIGRGLAAIRAGDGIERAFLWYALLWLQPRITGSDGAVFASISRAQIEELEIPLPPANEQKRIAARLDQAFAALDRARAKAEESLSDARLVFEAHSRELFSAGEGKAWSAATLCDLADFRNGINFTKASRGKEVRVLGVKAFQNHFHAPDTGLDRVTIDGDLDPSDCLQSGDIVFVRSNGNPELIGRSLVIERMSERTAHSGFTIRARLRDSKLVPSFLGHFLKSSAVRRQMVDGGTGTNIKSLNQGTLSRILVPLPSRAEQMRIVENLEAVRERTTHIEVRYTEQLADMASLRQSLLQAAFSGQLS